MQGNSVSKEPTPFDTIESALEFLHLLQVESGKARQEVESLMEQDGLASARREEAFRLVVESSQRVLNDLRALRTLLLRESSR